jgi:hypothetical protein
MVGAVETENCAAVTVPVVGAFALVSADCGATPSFVVARLEVCASAGGVDFGASVDDVAVSDGIPLSRNLLCVDDAGLAAVSVWSDASAGPAVPSVCVAEFDWVSWVDDWAPPDDDTVTPGATSTVCDEPLSASVAADDVVADVEGAVGPGCAADGAVAAVLPTAPWPPAGGESLVGSGFAHAIPAGAAMADPTPNATASAPIRPTKLLYSIVPTTPGQYFTSRGRDRDAGQILKKDVSDVSVSLPHQKHC